MRCVRFDCMQLQSKVVIVTPTRGTSHALRYLYLLDREETRLYIGGIIDVRDCNMIRRATREQEERVGCRGVAIDRNRIEGRADRPVQ